MDNRIGKQYTEQDFKALKEMLILLSKEEGIKEALDLLKYGYGKTTMTKEQFQEIYKTIVKG